MNDSALSIKVRTGVNLDFYRDGQLSSERCKGKDLQLPTRFPLWNNCSAELRKRTIHKLHCCAHLTLQSMHGAQNHITETLHCLIARGFQIRVEMLDIQVQRYKLRTVR